ncbi:MAG: PIN domain-containing protein [Planctomycetota bacterium]
MTLVDTSVWIAFLRRRDPLDLEKLVPMDEVATCLPVLQEVLQGTRDEWHYRRAAVALRALPVVESPLGEAVFLHAVELYRTARRAGITLRSGTDCLIAACAIRHDLEVLHDDRDYPAIARVSSLRERRIRR